MQKLRLANRFDKDTNKFDKDFDIKETDKIITGKINISSKKDEKWVSKTIHFVVFKSTVDTETQAAVKSGKPFLAEFTISVGQFPTQKGELFTFHQLVINKARPEGIDAHNYAKGNAYQPQQDYDDTIPF